ncbi:MAG: CDP-alcohol phosphatidyltransferase family protein [Thermomicrobium sp.]|nr:CDP-alcohol phosphatidyltransferase family protein [Thermomicrobium sp.]MDW8058498.1 CDP-alcohol phosphatidyltransferase family protein [Thermomicrobium sp.]
MANAITVGRLLLLFVGIGLLYTTERWSLVLAWVSLLVVFAGDALDGIVARRRGTTSVFGAVFDIAGDRVVENALWIVFADLGLIGVWAPLLVMTRGFLVDGLRSVGLRAGRTPFGERTLARTPVTRFLTASRTMRALYGIAKLMAFLFLAGVVAEREVGFPVLGWLFRDPVPVTVGWIVVYGTIVLTVVRGIPVLVDAWPYLRARPEELAMERADRESPTA